MISTIRGQVLAAAGSSMVIDVGGVGFHVNTTPALALAGRTGSEIVVQTALIVREDALTLFGFATRTELEVFELLIGVTGVGPKSALGVLSAMAPAQIAEAVAAESDSAFRKVSGIGPKTAKLIIVSLSGKLVGIVPESSTDAPAPTAPSAVGDSVLAALTGLGWNDRAASEALNDVLVGANASEAASVPALLRLALARLGPAQNGTR